MTIATHNRVPLTVLTHSSEATFKACPRRFYLRYRVGLVPAHESDALRLGSAFHAGLERLKLNGTVEQAVDDVHALYASRACPPWLDDEKYRVEELIAAALVRGYAARYASDIIVDYIAVERGFDLPIKHPQTGRPHEEIRNRGKIDGIARLPDGRIAILEHKTTGESIDMDSNYWRRLRLDSQISRYFLAARELGFDVSTVVYDVVRKPTIRPREIKKTERAIATANANYFGAKLTAACPERETPELYAARLLADITERPEHYFARVEIPRLERDLEEFAAEQWQIMQAIRSAERYGRYYRTSSACASPYPCTYINVCAGDAGDLDHQIPDGFKIADVPHPELSSIESETA